MVKAMKLHVKLARRQLMRGMSTLLDISPAMPRGYSRRDEMSALRGDMAKIGAEFSRVIERERNEKAALKETSRS